MLLSFYYRQQEFIWVFFFFFQAEDGIRDVAVTGVQTCALPIFGQAVREATLQGLNGRSRLLSEFHGKPLIINVWASWCGPCRKEMASLERLTWLGLARHFNVIG